MEYTHLRIAYFSAKLILKGNSPVVGRGCPENALFGEILLQLNECALNRTTYRSEIDLFQFGNLAVCQIVRKMQKQPPALHLGKFADSRVKLLVAFHFHYEIGGVRLWMVHSRVAQTAYEIHVIEMSPVLPSLGTNLPVGLLQQFFDRG
jgi:hypothetical protein